jgi:uncharacterized damage-inducible protein DinB
MSRLLSFVSGAILIASPPPLAAQGPGGPVGVAAAMQRGYAQMKANLTQAAEKMPDADYSFKPAGELRSFGGQIGHVANFHYLFCSAAKGEANPNQGQNLEQKTTKADFVKALADSFAYCDTPFSALTDESMSQMITQGRGGQVARGAVLMNLIAHDNEEYGIMTVYLRMKNLVPPSTENAGRGRGGARGEGRGRE